MGNKQNEIQTGFELNIIITGNLDFEKMRILFNYNNLQKTTKSFKNIAYEESIINNLVWIINYIIPNNSNEETNDLLLKLLEENIINLDENYS